jgi:hypothetical protein
LTRSLSLRKFEAWTRAEGWDHGRRVEELETFEDDVGGKVRVLSKRLNAIVELFHPIASQ